MHLLKNANCQLKSSTNTPPSTGPIAAPTVAIIPPTRILRSYVHDYKVEGIITDPPNPSKARHNTNPHELSNT